MVLERLPLLLNVYPTTANVWQTTVRALPRALPRAVHSLAQFIASLPRAVHCLVHCLVQFVHCLMHCAALVPYSRKVLDGS